MKRCLLLLVFAWKACADRVIDLASQTLQAGSVDGMIPGAAAAAAIRHRRARQERERRAREKRRKERERERKALEEKRRREEAHIRNHKVDCSWTEDWGDWSTCSATCGGGLSSSELVSRVVSVPQDTFGYGKACPMQCPGDGCGEKRYKACNADMCEIDCSTVDIGNRLSSGGVPTQWTAAPVEGQCVFQFWHIEKDSMRLLGETQQQNSNSSEAAVVEVGSTEQSLTISAHDAGSVALGFRGCNLPALGVVSSLGSVCLPHADAAFQEARQTRELSETEKSFLRRFRRESFSSLLREQSKLSVVTLDGTSSQSAASPAFELSVNMAAQPPPPPRLSLPVEVDEDVQIEVEASFDKGAAVTGHAVLIRKKFASGSNCEFTLLPSCAAGLGSGGPCVEELKNLDQFKSTLLLRNLYLASIYQVKVKAVSEAGDSDTTAQLTFSTRAAPGIPLSECEVAGWSLEGDEAELVLPEKDAPECKLQAPPLPACVMKPRKEFFSRALKCDGKKYWREFRPVMQRGEESCLDATFNSMKVCEHDLRYFGQSEGASTCQAAGCDKSVWMSNKQCCCEIASDSESDSPTCACTRETCSSLGLVAAKDPSHSCRH
eukprot:TRINITY_DN26872_c0_g1_i1.p1 TRINITY_DN26872_c0_g1~~TRINITY_DN26872_c0_g1_i1.p1  ORF type:complete len:606 (+),score=117.13 TRINITY_DN26872_c0_g1_i1:99-1916(+)